MHCHCSRSGQGRQAACLSLAAGAAHTQHTRGHVVQQQQLMMAVAGRRAGGGGAAGPPRRRARLVTAASVGCHCQCRQLMTKVGRAIHTRSRHSNAISSRQRHAAMARAAGWHTCWPECGGSAACAAATSRKGLQGARAGGEIRRGWLTFVISSSCYICINMCVYNCLASGSECHGVWASVIARAW